MRDLDAIDRQLRDLGEAPTSTADLLARVLGPDRSRERLERLLDEAVAAAPAAVAARAAVRARVPSRASSPSVAAAASDAGSDGASAGQGDGAQAATATIGAALAHDTLAGVAAPEPSMAVPEEGEVDAEIRDALIASAQQAVDARQGQAEPADNGNGKHEDSSRFAALFDFTNPPPPAVPQVEATAVPAAGRPPDEWLAERSPFPAVPPASSRPQPGAEETTERRSVPVPPSAEPVAADSDADAEEESFELLVDDEDIIEIDDDEMIVEDE